MSELLSYRQNNAQTRYLGADFLASALVAVVVFLFYLPALKNGFVNWDDQLYVYENLRIRSIDAKFIKWIFTEPVLANWHPLTMLSLAIDYSVWKLNPFGYHLTNNILHGANAFLASLLTARLSRMSSSTKKPSHHLMPAFIGAIAGLIFSLHPLRVESVAWVSERKDVLSAFFFLSSVIFFMEYVVSNKNRLFCYFISLVLFALALMSKPMAITLPAVLLLIDFYPLKRANKTIDLFIEKIPFFIAAFLCALAALWAQQKSGTISSLETLTLAERLGVSVRATAFYLYKTVLPYKLAPFYPLPLKTEMFGPAFAASFLVLSGITAVSLFFLKKNRLLLTIWLYFLVTLVPVIGLVQIGAQGAADRYTYIPSIGLSILIAAVIICASQAISKTKFLTVALIITVILSVPLGLLTLKQSSIWKDPLTLWTYQVKSYPGSSALPYNNLGLAYDSSGDFDNALKNYNVAIVLNPKYTDSIYNKAFALQRLDKCNEAISGFTRVIELKPSFINSYMNRGICYATLGDFNRAIDDFTVAGKLDPSNKASYINLALAQKAAGDLTNAQENFSKAEKLDAR